MLIAALVFAILVALFAIQNASLVTVHFAIWSRELSLVLVILGAAGLGALAVAFASAVKGWGVRAQLRDERARTKRLENELGSLRERLARAEAERDQLGQAYRAALRAPARAAAENGGTEPPESGPVAGS